MLGGGGYNHVNVARSWAYLTLALSGELDCDEATRGKLMDVPEHEFSELYSDFSLEVPLGNRMDENQEIVGEGKGRYVDTVVEKCLKRIGRIIP